MTTNTTARRPKVAMNVRVNEWTKEQVDRYAADRDMTQARAADDLIRIGLLALQFLDGKTNAEALERAVAYVVGGMAPDGRNEPHEPAGDPVGTAPLFREPGATS